MSPASLTPSGPPRLGSRLATVLGLCLAALVTLAGPAVGHAVLKSANPAAGSTVRTAPPRFELVFSEEVDPSLAQLVVEDARGARPVEGTTVRGPSVSAPFPEGLVDGSVTVRYRVVSADSHPIAGEVTFTLATDGPTSTGATTASGASASPTASAAAPTAARETASGVGTLMMTALMGLAVVVLVVVGVLLVRSDRRGRRS